jgi:hypothetical protein
MLAVVYLSDIQPFPVTIGNSQTGVAIGFGACLGSPINLLGIVAFGSGLTVPCCEYPVIPDPAAVSGEVDVVDCGLNIVVGQGLTNTVNGDASCPCGANLPPVAICQDVTVSADASCTADASIDNGSFDPDGDAITLTQTPPGPYPVGTTSVTLTVDDGNGGTATCPGLVTVLSPPGDVTITLNRDCLWPPNHKMADIYATVELTGSCCPTPPVVTLMSVTSNEPDNGRADGNTTDDIVIISDTHVQLRSERSGQGDGRIYTLTYEVVDCSGNTTIATAEVRVPHDRAGGACASMGFAPGGVELDPALSEFALVIRSIGKFDATALDVTKTYVGNVKGVAKPVRSMEIDNNADGLTDLAVFYSARALSILQDEGPIGLHYRSAVGIDYLVPNIFELGEPVPLVPTIVIPRTDEDQGDGRFGNAPAVTTLLPSYPNPFNPSTTIPFNLVSTERVTLRIYSAQGKLVRTLENGTYPAGLHRVIWDGRDNNSREVATGAYFVRFTAGSVETTRKVVLIR